MRIQNPLSVINKKNLGPTYNIKETDKDTNIHTDIGYDKNITPYNKTENNDIEEKEEEYGILFVALYVDILEDFVISDLPLDQSWDQDMHGASFPRYYDNLVSTGLQEVDGEKILQQSTWMFQHQKEFLI